MYFEKYPFEKLHELFVALKKNNSYNPISLTIGEPQFPTPTFIQEALQKSSAELSKYPNSRGEESLREAVIDYIMRRYKISLKNSEVILSFGTREVLFNLPQFLLLDKKNPIIAYPNPFYQIYEGAARVSRARSILMPLNNENNFTPFLSKEEMQEVHVVILNSPNNPTGKAMSLDELKLWVQYALEYDFIIISDECYSEIYQDAPPHSILEASKAIGNFAFKNILALNSISKRSNAPGLRSGYLAGDFRILQEYMRYRTYLGCAIPLPLQRAATLAWADDETPKKAREVYTNNFFLAKEMLNIAIEPYTFYIWLYVEDDISFTKKIYEQYAVSVLPGSFLGREGVGKGYVRIALVHETIKCKEALQRLSSFYSEFMH